MSYLKEHGPISSPTEQLKTLLKQVPQINEDGDLVYLITNGFAVDLVTGVSRPHDDVDLVVLKPSDQLKEFGIDTFTPNEYLAGMKLDPEFLRKTAQKISFTTKGETYPLSIVHPAIILVQKTTQYPYNGNRFPRQPKDEIEIRTIMNYWQSLTEPESWIPVIGQALTCLPRERQMRTWNSLRNIASEVAINRKFRRPAMHVLN